jgi:two-component system chemotaxis sensor kinase CheA
MTEDLQTQLKKDLVVESFESLEQFDRDLMAIEKDEATPDTLNSMFRSIHTLKGSSGCLGLGRIEKVAHAGENLLSALRDGRLTPQAEMITALLACADALRAMLGHIQDTGEEGDFDHSKLMADLQRLHEATSNERTAEKQAFGLFADDEASPEPAAEAAGADPMKEIAAPAVRVAPVAAESAIRVDVGQLDTLMDLVGELVLARNQIVQLSSQREAALTNATQRLNHITTKLQENVMKTRMQPIGTVWSRFPRVVRDVAHEVGKQVALEMEGADTELDRTIIEAIKDPLTHLVRNAVDHGVERPEARQAKGKPAQGTLRLRAFHEGGQVIIEITDDGAGIDRERVRSKAIAKGLVSDDHAARLSERELYQLLFAPGFSTAEAVTNLSGRGVGLDVVKKNIEKIGGTVDVQSELGFGTTFRLKIPLTLAIIPALIIGCAGTRYAVPQASLIELVRIDAEQASSTVELIGDQPVYRLRGSLLPLVYLRRELNVKQAATAEDATFLLVLQAEGRQFGLVVDSISDTEEIVVKPLGKELKNLPVYAGATIMGDGRVALILDVIGIARRANVLGDTRADARAAAQRAEKQAEGEERQSLLLVSVGDEDHGSRQQIAVPLAAVARLEEFPVKTIERSGRSEVVQYRGEIMPLVRVRTLLDAGAPAETEVVKVIVYLHRGRNVGLVVDQIIDTVEDHVHLQRCANRPGILGSAVVQKRVTDFLDTGALIENSGVVAFDLAT